MKKRTHTNPDQGLHAEAQAELDLIADCAAALERVAEAKVRVRGGKALRAGAVRPDAHLRAQLAGQALEYAVEVKRTLRDDAIGPITHQARAWAEDGQRLLLCATRIPDRLGGLLRENGVDYLDTDGNVHLHGPGVFVLVQGRKPTRPQCTRPGLRGTDVRLLGVFLRDADAGEQIQTELARRAGIALGAVGKARAHLVRLGVLEAAGPRHWQVRDRAAGLRLFGEGWATLIRGRLRPRNFHLVDALVRGTLEERIAAAAPGLAVLLGGERAAAHLTGFLDTDHATLHVARADRRAAADALGLVPAEDGPITMLDRYGEGDVHTLDTLPETPLAHPLCVWAECLTVRDERVAQAARRILEKLQTHE
jgi:hypothetical protein